MAWGEAPKVCKGGGAGKKKKKKRAANKAKGGKGWRGKGGGGRHTTFTDGGGTHKSGLPGFGNVEGKGRRPAPPFWKLNKKKGRKVRTGRPALGIKGRERLFQRKWSGGEGEKKSWGNVNRHLQREGKKGVKGKRRGKTFLKEGGRALEKGKPQQN